MNLDILYEDQDLLLVNKPSGLVVNRSSTLKEESIQDWMLKKFGEEYFNDQYWFDHQEYKELIPADFEEDFGNPLDIWKERLGIVHRLDKDTSGVLLLAKNPGALVNLLTQFKNRQTKKKYLALVHGKFRETSGQIIAPMARSKFNRLKFSINNEGREAVTDYQVKKEFNGLKEEFIDVLAKMSKNKSKRVAELYQAGFCLVELRPKTGRTHQIRVHMTAMQHPLVGDQIYAGRKQRKLDVFWCKRQFLHAVSLEFIHPRAKKAMKIEAPLADDLNKVLELVV